MFSENRALISSLLVRPGRPTVQLPWDQVQTAGGARSEDPAAGVERNESGMSWL